MRCVRLLLLVICVPILVSASYNTNSAASSSYDIANIYEKVELKEGSKPLDSYGNVKDTKAIREDAILNVTTNYGYTRGEVIF